MTACSGSSTSSSDASSGSSGARATRRGDDRLFDRACGRLHPSLQSRRRDRQQRRRGRRATAGDAKARPSAIAWTAGSRPATSRPPTCTGGSLLTYSGVDPDPGPAARSSDPQPLASGDGGGHRVLLRLGPDPPAWSPTASHLHAAGRGSHHVHAGRRLDPGLRRRQAVRPAGLDRDKLEHQQRSDLVHGRRATRRGADVLARRDGPIPATGSASSGLISTAAGGIQSFTSSTTFQVIGCKQGYLPSAVTPIAYTVQLNPPTILAVNSTEDGGFWPASVTSFDYNATFQVDDTLNVGSSDYLCVVTAKTPRLRRRIPRGPATPGRCWRLRGGTIAGIAPHRQNAGAAFNVGTLPRGWLAATARSYPRPS